MTKASILFGGAGGKESLLTDPRMLPRFITSATNLSDSSNNSTAAGFWTNVNSSGVAINSDYTAATYKTIASISGAGELMHAIGPTTQGSSETTTFEITIDGGTVITTAGTPAASGDRVVLGPAGYVISNTPYWNISKSLGEYALDASKRFVTNAGSQYIASPFELRKNGMPRLRFNASLLVRIMHSAGVTNTALQGRQSGCTYILD